MSISSRAVEERGSRNTLDVQHDALRLRAAVYGTMSRGPDFESGLTRDQETVLRTFLDDDVATTTILRGETRGSKI